MNTTFLAMSISMLLGIGLLLGLGALSILSGALNFLFVKPKIGIYKSQLGDKGFAFSFEWDQNAEPVKFDRIQIHLFNPFGLPAQLEITREFEASSQDFVRDLDFGEKFVEIINAKGINDATIEFHVSSSSDNVSHQISIKGKAFIDKYKNATMTIDEVRENFMVSKVKPLFEIPERTFISPPLPKSSKALKLATNPEFAGQFSVGSTEAAGASSVPNFSVSKVWIEPGCIVCDACEAIFPEVFEVTDSTCIIRPGAPMDDGLRIQESAEACPVEVIKFTRIA